MDSYKIIGDKIRSIREAQSLTQEEVARLSGISQAYFNRIENGKNERVGVVLLFKILEILKVEAEEFFSNI